MMLIGDNGSGKSGAVASLADAGYNIRMLDLDNGIDVLASLLKDPKAGYKRDALDRAEYDTITDQRKHVNAHRPPPQAP